jgi:transitional endoplasmic reticulum ATPase
MNQDFVNNLIEALKFSPDNILLRTQLAELLLAVNRNDEAEEHYLYILKTDANNSKARIGLAIVYYKQSNFSTAAAILEPEVDTHGNPEALVLYAKVLLKLNKISEARKYYKLALDLSPNIKDHELDSMLRIPSGEVQKPIEELNADDELEDRFVKQPSDVTFKDVGGMDDVKEEINIKIIQPLKHAELYKAYGKKTGGGILLYGPPGCGKTHLARATAGEVQAAFMAVGINDILEMWIGESEKNLNMIFETARRSTPCVLFFDEVDALGASRSDMKQSAGRHLINQFLSEMDGVEDNNDGLLVLAATNAPWHLDPAFRRPGRFDRIIFVKPPDEVGREHIFKLLLEKKPVKDIRYSDLAKISEEFSGADLEAAVDLAVEEKLRASFKTGVPEPITTQDMLAAIKKIKPSTKEWFSTARNYALYANEAGLYDDILTYLKIKK